MPGPMHACGAGPEVATHVPCYQSRPTSLCSSQRWRCLRRLRCLPRVHFKPPTHAWSHTYTHKTLGAIACCVFTRETSCPQAGDTETATHSPQTTETSIKSTTNPIPITAPPVCHKQLSEYIPTWVINISNPTHGYSHRSPSKPHPEDTSTSTTKPQAPTYCHDIVITILVPIQTASCGSSRGRCRGPGCTDVATGTPGQHLPPPHPPAVLHHYICLRL